MIHIYVMYVQIFFYLFWEEIDISYFFYRIRLLILLFSQVLLCEFGLDIRLLKNDCLNVLRDIYLESCSFRHLIKIAFAFSLFISIDCSLNWISLCPESFQYSSVSKASNSLHNKFVLLLFFPILLKSQVIKALGKLS